MTPEGLSCGVPLQGGEWGDVRRCAALDCFKWNLEDEGRCRLSSFPLLLEPQLYRQLCRWAVALDEEARCAESELVLRPRLSAKLGLPWRLLLALRASAEAGRCRYARFDFHPTTDGTFAITEGNLDVAGGFNESSGVTKLFLEHVTDAESGGDPAMAIAASLRAALGDGGAVGLLHMTNFVDDHQVVRFLAMCFEEVGLVPVLFGPSQLEWTGSQAYALVGRARMKLDAVFRFFPADWLSRLAASSRWWRALGPGATLWMNPTTSILTQSKRFPLTWSRLTSSLPTWRRLLPETRNPRDIDGGDWVLKPALAHEGYRVGMKGVTMGSQYASITRDAARFPWRWAAQRRFDAAVLPTPDGPRHPCIGVYVVDGRPAGLYGRLAVRPLINDKSEDAVVLVRRAP